MAASTLKTVEGDLIALALDGEFDVIVHGCNCFCTMGAGIARSIKTAFPEAFDADRQTAKGDRAKLGTCSQATCETPNGPLTIVNAYTQFSWRGRGVKVDYDAVRSCAQWVSANFASQRVGLPRIGAGLAGGDWDTIQAIFSEELAGVDATVVEYVPSG